MNEWRLKPAWQDRHIRATVLVRFVNTSQFLLVCLILHESSYAPGVLPEVVHHEKRYTVQPGANAERRDVTCATVTVRVSFTFKLILRRNDESPPGRAKGKPRRHWTSKEWSNKRKSALFLWGERRFGRRSCQCSKSIFGLSCNFFLPRSIHRFLSPHHQRGQELLHLSEALLHVLLEGHSFSQQVVLTPWKPSQPSCLRKFSLYYQPKIWQTVPSFAGSGAEVKLWITVSFKLRASNLLFFFIPWQSKHSLVSTL